MKWESYRRLMSSTRAVSVTLMFGVIYTLKVIDIIGSSPADGWWTVRRGVA